MFGRYEGRAANAPAIMLGSHIDTVVNAGRYDGNLGVLAAIAVVEELARTGERLAHAIEVAAFGEEEGSRFPTHILTSSALTGAATPALLDLKDADGISVREALSSGETIVITPSSRIRRASSARIQYSRSGSDGGASCTPAGVAK